MSRVFVDTSAILALLNPDDQAHAQARRAFGHLETQGDTLITSSYVLVETYALLLRRFGRAAVKAFHDDFECLLETVWVTMELHHAGIERLLKASSRTLSLVDAVSFEVIARGQVTRTFAFDKHFAQEGIALL